MHHKKRAPAKKKTQQACIERTSGRKDHLLFHKTRVVGLTGRNG